MMNSMHYSFTTFRHLALNRATMEVHIYKMLRLIFMGVITLFLLKDTNEREKQIQEPKLNVCNLCMRVARNSFDMVRLRKRASIDLNRSPPRSPSPSLNEATEASSINKAEPIKNQQGYDSPATAKKKKRRLQIGKSVRKYYARYTEKSRIEAEQMMSAEEYASYLITFNRIRKKNNERDRKYAARQKILRKKGDPQAYTRYAKRLARNQKSYSRRKSKKDTQKNQNDFDPPLTKRANGDTTTQSQEQPKGKRKSRNDYGKQFTKKQEKEAQEKLTPEKFRILQKRIEKYRFSRAAASRENYKCRKAKRLNADEKSIKAYDLKLERKRTKEAKERAEKFLANGRVYDKTSKTEDTSKQRDDKAENDGIDTELRLFRRSPGNSHSSYPDNVPFQPTQRNELLKRANLSDNLTEKQPAKKRPSYHARFTKKAEEEARKTLSDSDYKEYQMRLDRYRANRSKYGKTRNNRFKEARKAGDLEKIKAYEHHLQTKKTKYKQNSLGVFLASDSLSDHHRKQIRGNDADLHALLQQPLDRSTRKHVETKLADRQRGRDEYREKVNLIKSGDPKAEEWLELKRKRGRIATAKYKKAREEAKMLINDLVRKPD